MSSDDVAISVRGVSKHYLMFDRPEDRLKQMVFPKLQRMLGLNERLYFRDFSALRDVSFDIRKGETVGVVGRNGSGKSTLLQVICGVLQPSSGEVQVNGRIAALLELGAGFNPEFTGRENVYLNSAILGLSRAEIDARIDEILRFADIGHFIDQPVKTYSSGMHVRLAFATAINVDPDILVVDEALAVGDEAFQRKCFSRIEEIKANGATILFVSHSPQSVVQLCSRALLFDAGELLMHGRPKVVTSQYQRLLGLAAEEAQRVREQIRSDSRLGGKAERDAGAVQQQSPVMEPPEASQELFDPALISQSRIEHEAKGVRIEDVRLLNAKGERVNIIECGRRYRLCYDVVFEADCEDVGFGIGIRTVTGFSFGGANMEGAKDQRRPVVSAGTRVTAQFEFECILLPDHYFINLAVTGRLKEARGHLGRITDALLFRVAQQDTGTAGGFIDFGIRLSVEGLA